MGIEQEKPTKRKGLSVIAKVNWMFIFAMFMVYLLFALVGGIAPVDWSAVSKVFFVILEVVGIVAGLVVNVLYTTGDD